MQKKLSPDSVVTNNRVLETLVSLQRGPFEATTSERKFGFGC